MISEMNEEKLYNILKELEVEYDVIEHNAVFSFEDKLEFKVKGFETVNLFLKVSKGEDYYLIVKDGNSGKVDIKLLAKMLGVKKFSFASGADLMKCLGVEAGSVTIFGLINDRFKKVFLKIDKNIKDYEFIYAHPLRNTASIKIGYLGLIKFIDYLGIKYEFIDVPLK